MSQTNRGRKSPGRSTTDRASTAGGVDQGDESRPHLVLLQGEGLDQRFAGGTDPCWEGGDEAGTTTAEYTVVTAAAVAFGALLLKLLTGGWGQKILETAFREVIKMLGF